MTSFEEQFPSLFDGTVPFIKIDNNIASVNEFCVEVTGPQSITITTDEFRNKLLDKQRVREAMQKIAQEVQITNSAYFLNRLIEELGL